MAGPAFRGGVKFVIFYVFGSFLQPAAKISPVQCALPPVCNSCLKLTIKRKLIRIRNNIFCGKGDEKKYTKNLESLILVNTIALWQHSRQYHLPFTTVGMLIKDTALLRDRQEDKTFVEKKTSLFLVISDKQYLPVVKDSVSCNY